MTAWLDELARVVIEEEARTRRVLETGGPIFGYEGADGNDIVIAAAFGPGPKARHWPLSLVPDRAATGEVIARVHELSEGRYRYLGSWHTHPFGQPRPSGVDIATARDISLQVDVGLPKPLLLIQATRPARRQVGIGSLAAYRWDPATESMEEVPLEVAKLDERLIPSSTSSSTGRR